MSKYHYNQKKLTKYVSNIKSSLVSLSLISYMSRWEKVFRTKNLDFSIFQGIQEAFQLINDGNTRTGIFVLGRTIEELLDIYIEICHDKKFKIGLNKKDFQDSKETFSFSQKVEFFAGEEVQLLRVYKKSRRTRTATCSNCGNSTTKRIKRTSKFIQYNQQPLIRSETKKIITEIRKYGRNIGAHKANAAEIKYLNDNLIRWVENGLIFIYDTYGIIIPLKQK